MRFVLGIACDNSGIGDVHCAVCAPSAVATPLASLRRDASIQWPGAHRTDA
jgi:hypothetical protein